MYSKVVKRKVITAVMLISPEEFASSASEFGPSVSEFGSESEFGSVEL